MFSSVFPTRCGAFTAPGQRRVLEAAHNFCSIHQRPIKLTARKVSCRPSIGEQTLAICQQRSIIVSVCRSPKRNQKVSFFSTSTDCLKQFRNGKRHQISQEPTSSTPVDSRRMINSDPVESEYRGSNEHVDDQVSKRIKSNESARDEHFPRIGFPKQWPTAFHLVYHRSNLCLGPYSIFMVKLLAALCVVAAIHDYIFDFCPAVGPSMQPLIESSGDLLIFERKHFQYLRTFVHKALKNQPTGSFSCSPYRRGDVIIAHSLDEKPMKICKRILALPGDWITLPPQDVNTRRSTPKLWHPNNDFTPFPWTFQIPPGHVWLQGDNMAVSRDSRFYGPVPEANILGRVFCRIWPIWRFRWITSNSDFAVKGHG